MAYEVKPVYQPDVGQLLMRGFEAYRGVKGIQQQEAMQKAQIKGSDRDREIREKEFQMRQGEQERKQEDQYSKEFAQERANTASQMRGKTPEEKVSILEARISRLTEQGKDPSSTQRLLDMYQTGIQGKADLETAQDRRQSDQAYEQSLQLKTADNRIEEAYQTGVNTGLIKPKEEKEGYRILSDLEKSAAGIKAEGVYQQSPQGKISKVGGVKTAVNVSNIISPGGKYKTGSIPPGYALSEVNGKPVYIEIKGGPVEKKRVEDIKKEEIKRETIEEKATIVGSDIERLQTLVEDSPWYNPVTGISGAIFSNIPGTARKDAEGLQRTITANIGFDRLQEMREGSKTGGALGAISEREMKQLESVKGSIDFAESDEQILRNLQRLDDIYSKILKKARAYPNAEQFGFGRAKPMPAVNRTNQSSQMPAEARARYK